MIDMDLATARRDDWEVPSYEEASWRGRQHDYCVIIPVINEGERIRNLLRRMADLDIACLADIIVIDGGSTDGSLDSIFLEEQGVRGLLVKTGPGKLSAQLRCAYAFALDQGYEGIVTIDGNNKDDPDPIPTFIKAMKDGIDFVQASRFVAGGLNEHTPRTRIIAIRLIHAPALSYASGFPWTDTTQGFRAYSRRMLLDKRLGIFRDTFSDYELLAYLNYRAPKLGYRCQELPTARRYPKTGKMPTKISGFNGNWRLIQTLIAACTGRYNP
jgi:glycosyltransferase involved in cell wall biosynthesis